MELINKSKKGRVVASSPADSQDVDDKNVVTVPEVPGEDHDQTIARARLHPIVRASTTMRHFDSELAKNSAFSIAKELGRHVENVKAGDMSRAESILISQANTLDVIFNMLAARAGMNVGTHADAADRYLRMALKAQSQCRTTLEALAEIKMPKSATFIRQANIAEQQQVNNGNVTNGGSAPAHEKNLTQPNELLTEAPHAALDTRGTRTAGGADPQMAAVGKIDGATKRGRKNAQ
jgi:hypothetical protein